MSVEHITVVPGIKDQNAAHPIPAALATVIRAEAEALLALSNHLPDAAETLVQLILATTGKVVFSGIGKSGLIAKKIVATFSSLGIASFFLHPTEAVHGDLGAVQPGDLFIALSKSGTGWEFEYILPVLRSQHIPTSLICCHRGAVADLVDVVMLLRFDQEACVLGLAPTSSSTLMLAFGDALAVVVSSQRQFTRQAFARNHPAGALGKKLLLTVRSFMLTGELLPLLKPHTLFQEVLVHITAKKCGMGIVVNEQNNLLGVVTDGDLRRACDEGPIVFQKTALKIATKTPKIISPDTLAYIALEMMKDFHITTLVVAEHNRVVGLVHIHDLVKAGITT
jgi:arabinose-5-phosphate isomerase